MHETALVNLVAGFRCGDSIAFARVWDRYLSQIMRDIARFTDVYDEQEELLQQIRIVLYQSRQRFVGTDNLGGWIHGVCRRCCLQWVRVNRGLDTHRSAFELMIDPLVDIESEVEAAAYDYDRLCERVLQAMCDLTPRQREIVERRIVHRQSVAEIAADLHCAVGTVKATSHTVLKRLRHQLQDTTDMGFGGMSL